MIRGVLIWFCLFAFASSLAAELTGFRLQSSSVFSKEPGSPGELPGYLEVLDTLLALYYPDLPENDYLSIARKPTGYYVGINRQDDVYPQDFIPFWLEGDPGPRKLPYRAKTSEPFPHYGTETAGYWKANQFDRHLYFGYPDFTKDVLLALDLKDNRTDLETQQLARAHSEHAMNLLNNQYGTSAPANRFKLDETSLQQLNSRQLDSYLAHLRRCVELYGQLPATTSTPVGDASTKYGNEIMSGYLTLLQYTKPQVAQNFLQEQWKKKTSDLNSAAAVAYDEHLLFCARLLLESCPINAILITEGDNDTYPLLFLQLVEQLRPDILVINRHLLHLPRYLQVLRTGIQPGGQLVLSQNEQTIRRWENEQFLPGERAVLFTPDEVKEVLKNLSGTPKSAAFPLARLPFGGIQLTKAVDGPLFRPEASILGLGNLVMLDLIATNYGQRPVAISVAIDQAYFAYGNSWQQVGLVYNLGDEKPYYSVDINGTVAWGALLKPAQPIRYAGKQSRFYLDCLEKLVIATADYLERSNERIAAIELIDNYLSHLDRQQIFNQFHSSQLLPLMHRLHYDPALISAYVGMVKEAMLSIPDDQRGEYYTRRVAFLQHYLNAGEFLPR